MSKIIKKSYPNMPMYDDSATYDLDKWYSCEKKIASYVSEGHSLGEALNYVSKTNFDNEKESYDFYHWIKNRANYKTASLEKEAVYGFSANSYYQNDYKQSDLPDSVQYYKQKHKDNLEKVKKEEDFQSKKDEEISPVDSKRGESPEEKAFHRYYLGLMRLFLKSPNVDSKSYGEIHSLLGQLGSAFHGLKSKTAQADLIYNASSRLKKMGYDQASDISSKFAQQLESQPEQPAAQNTEQAQPPAAQPETAQGEAPQSQNQPAEGERLETTPEEGGGVGISVPRNDEVDAIRFEDIKVPDQDPERYKDLTGDVDVSDAAEKLDEIAGMLADRRVIRKLAEFDIMLDRLGIASMFPELAESQSKLIDAFSYALTRVTKMMGQLSQAQQVIKNTSGRIPGNEKGEAQVENPEQADQGPGQTEQQ